MKYFIGFILLLISFCANSEIYKYVDAEGNVTYSLTKDSEDFVKTDIETPDFEFKPRSKNKPSKSKLAEQKKLKKDREIKQASQAKRDLLPENMAKLGTFEVCTKAGEEWRNKKTDNWLNEIKRRKLKFNELSIKDGTIKIGGFECDVFAAYGAPERYNRTVNQYGTKVQFVYNRTYVYTDNGIIT